MLSFNFQIYLLSSVLFRFSLLVKLVSWRLRCVLNVFDVRPMQCFLFSEVDAVAWYIMFFIVHFPGRGQFSLLQRLLRSG